MPLFLFIMLWFGCSTGQAAQPIEPGKYQSVHDFTMTTIDGKSKSLADYKGKVILIVNVASQCGLTPQYKDLQALFQKYQSQGLVVLGFPANDFLRQEPGTNQEIATFCEKNYGVTFDMFEKISVKGKDIHPLYQFLTQKEHNGSIDAPISWNFQKFLVDKQGKVVAHFAPRTKVDEPEVIKTIEQYLR